MDVRRRRRAWSGLDHVARQPAKPEAGDPWRPGVHEGGRAGGGRDERVGDEFFGKPIIADWRQQLSFTTKIFRARGLHLDDRHIRHAGGDGLLGRDRRRHSLRRQQPPTADRVGRVAGVVPAEDSDRRRGGVVERHPVGARRTSAAAGGHDQDLRPGRTGRSQLPVDGDPRGAWAPLRRLRYRALGLHQQRVRRDGVGSVVRESEHRSDHDDLRLHAHV